MPPAMLMPSPPVCRTMVSVSWKQKGTRGYGQSAARGLSPWRRETREPFRSWGSAGQTRRSGGTAWENETRGCNPLHGPVWQTTTEWATRTRTSNSLRMGPVPPPPNTRHLTERSPPLAPPGQSGGGAPPISTSDFCLAERTSELQKHQLSRTPGGPRDCHAGTTTQHSAGRQTFTHWSLFVRLSGVSDSSRGYREGFREASAPSHFWPMALQGPPPTPPPALHRTPWA